jgi:hypothetical protein
MAKRRTRHQRKKAKRKSRRRRYHESEKGRGFISDAKKTAVRVATKGLQDHVDYEKNRKEVEIYMAALAPLLREKGTSEADIQGLTELFKEAPVHFHRMQRDPGYYFEQMRGHNVRGRAYRPPLRRGQTQSSPTRRRSSTRRRSGHSSSRRSSTRRSSTRRSKPSRVRSF